MSIIMMICFARSGGTVLNQCLGSLPNVVMMSEVSPLAGNWRKGNMALGTIKDQAKNWYQIDLKSNDFMESALELKDICERNGRQLIIRDWTFGSFISAEENNFNPPNSFSYLDVLEGKCDIIPFCFVRDSIDIWISLTKRLPIEIEGFFAQYLKYVQAVRERNIQVFKYEDFVKRPEDKIRQICQYIGLEFSDSYKDYMSYDKVMGDTQFDPPSRGRKICTIKPLPRRLLPRKRIIELNQCEEMIKANKLLDYPTSYYDVEREGVLSTIRGRYSRLIYRYLYRYPMRLLSKLKQWL